MQMHPLFMDDSPVSDFISQIRTLRQDLVAGKTSWQEVRGALRRFHGPQLWQSPQWREVRQRIISSRCDQCGSIDPPFTLQHERQPPTFSRLLDTFRNEHRRAAWLLFEETHPLEIQTATRLVCPSCSSTNIYFRKRLSPHWRCTAPRCGFQFEEPGSASVPDRIANANLKQARWRAFLQEYAMAHVEVARETGHQAALAAIDWTVWYVSCAETVTHCRLCAYMWDKKQLKRCSACRQAWVELWSSLCANCDPDYVLCSVCSLHKHHKRWHHCYECHISAEQG
jgi:transposase-like protein